MPATTSTGGFQPRRAYTKLNSAPITGLTHTDTGLSAAPVGATYYYVLCAVDGSGDESVKSAAVGLTITDSGDGGGGGGGGGGSGGGGVTGGGGGGGCFISVAGLDLSPDLLKPIGAMALLICLIWISRRRKKGQND